MELLEKSIQKVARNTTALYEKIDLNISEQTTSGRNEQSTLKNIKKVAQQLEKKETEIVKQKNEISRVIVILMLIVILKF